uniref:Platelet-derived growth factor subunit B n=1 Tax=Astyanax mexicanus TaxID=7994 RepID=A0A3B1IKA4_ASTMX
MLSYLSWVLTHSLSLSLSLSLSQNDPLPAALAELVRSGSISSSEELQLLLLSDSVDDDRESSHANNTNNRLPRSLLAAQPAQQALCKVRTEVMEVTRSMLDRSNANFLLWPPCVEVQRCSGCCNTKSLKCVPVLTHTRYLQVMKIQYANMRPVYDKAIVSVNDHVECRCQPAPRPAPRRKSPAHKHEVLRDRSGKPRSKDELHRRDELKHNQRLRLEDLLDDSWLPREKHSDHNKTHHSGHKAEFDGDGRKHNSSSNGTRGGGFLERLTIPLPNHTERKETDGSLSLLNVTSSEQREQFHKGKSETLKNTTVSEHSLTTQGHVPLHESNLNNQVQRNTSLNQKHNAPPTRQTHETYGVTPHPTQEKQGHSDDRLKGNETPEPDRTGETEDKKTSSVLLMEKKALEEEKEELLLLHKLLDEEKHKHLQKTQHSEQEHQKHHQKHQHTYTTTQHTSKLTSSSTPPQPPPQPPRPPPQPPKKRRKHRNRISKAAMRAMLM